MYLSRAKDDEDHDAQLAQGERHVDVGSAVGQLNTSINETRN